MENSIEEDTKNIEEIIELSKEEIDAKDENITAILDIEDLISLEHILSDYKRLLKENEQLNAEVNSLKKENEELNYKLHSKKIALEIYNRYIPKSKLKDIIDRIDYDIKKTKEIISKNTNIYASYRKNDYQIVRLRAMNTKSLDIKKRLQELLEREE